MSIGRLGVLVPGMYIVVHHLCLVNILMSYTLLPFTHYRHLSATPPIKKAFHLSYALRQSIQNILKLNLTLSVIIVLKHTITGHYMVTVALSGIMVANLLILLIWLYHIHSNCSTCPNSSTPSLFGGKY
jgi:hypothetical protein